MKLSKIIGLIVLLPVLWGKALFAQDLPESKADGNIIYKYKQYEKFDLGELEIKGSIIAPGDLSVQKKDFKKFDLNLYERYHFDDFTQDQIKDLR